MAKKMPSVLVTFKEKGITAIGRGERGIVCLVLEEDLEKVPANPAVLYTIDDIPETISDENKEQIKLSMMGYQRAPLRVITHYIAKPESEAAQDYTEVLKKLEHTNFNYLVIPQIAQGKVQDIATWIKQMRTVKDTMFKAVLPNCPADCEGVVNFTNTTIRTNSDNKTYTTAQYCSRIAGIIAGTPLTISCTYAPLPEVIEVEPYTADEMNSKVAHGELFLFDDGEKIKVASGVNSFVTTMQGKGEDYQKIKLVDIMDLIHDDIKKTGHDSYIGKYANSYDNRCLLVTAINGYYDQLEQEGLLERGQNTAYIDIETTKTWLKNNGLATSEELATMKDLDVKYQNIHDNVFIASDLSILDAIENITVKNNIA